VLLDKTPHDRGVEPIPAFIQRAVSMPVELELSALRIPGIKPEMDVEMRGIPMHKCGSTCRRKHL
jgi:hypothetical protein